MKYNLDTFCAKPFTHRVVTPSGMIRPCCESRSENSYSEKDFLDLQKDLLSGIKNPDCRDCWEKEDQGLDSSTRDKNQNQDLSKIRFLELNLSNKCNLTCKMCGSDSSDSWGAIEKKLLNNNEVKAFRKQEAGQFVKAFKSQESFMSFLDACQLESLERIKLAGGEPFMQKDLIPLLQKLLVSGNKDVKILIYTNGTVWHKEAIEILKKFSNVDIRISLEATGDLYRYIRGGKAYTFTDINNFVFKIKDETHFRLSMNSAISAYCVFGLADLFIWAKNQIGTDDSVFHIYPVFVPEYLAPFVLPEYVRQDAFEYNKFKLYQAGLDTLFFVGHLQRLLLKVDSTDPNRYYQFLKFTEELDRIQGQNFSRVLPQEKVAQFFASGSMVNL